MRTARNVSIHEIERALSRLYYPNSSRHKFLFDQLSIPESLRGRELSEFRFSGRLGHILGYKGCRLLGDLHGLRLSELSKYRGCGRKSLAELLAFVMALQQESQPARKRVAAI